MSTIGNFSEVFGVGFAVNGLLTYVDIDPAHRSRLQKLVLAMEDLRSQCKARNIVPPAVSGDHSTEWAFQWILRMQRQFWQRLTLIVSGATLFLLIWSAYFPHMQFPWWASIPITISIFGVPLRSYLICKKIERALEHNVFALAKALDINAKAYMASKGIIAERPTSL